jgi:hypothetical protein
MARFVQVVGRLFNRAEQEPNKKPGMKLDETEVTVEINSEGKMSLPYCFFFSTGVRFSAIPASRMALQPSL